jgi:type II secretory ATPase GspE/PulE/Tfp pilus assembly ATPase PilB-like protein
MSQDARLDEEQAAQRRARILGLQYADTSRIATKQLYKEILNPDEINSIRAVPLVADAHNITFGIVNTTSQQMMAALRQRFMDQRVSFVLISDAGFREYVQLYNPPKKVVYQDIALNNAGDQGLVEKVSSTLTQVRGADTLAYLVQQAHKLAASDIHLETQNEFIRIRFRIDGVLHTIARMAPDKYRILITEIASAANVSTAADDAQQGHIAQKVQMADGASVDVNLRLETVPTVSGMDVVMRLFNMRQDMYQLDRLGLSQQERAIVDGIIAKPSGLVMVVGPTGSGKTTTLYSMLNSLNSDERKIITIEDPVEYQFEGITQISVSTQSANQTSFADKLRAVLRLDPDIVMVGEIRDMDTAKTALQASLTGHLVLATFHASSASAALVRLMDVIGQNPLFVSAIRLVMAQRLVRRLDDNLKQAYQPSEEQLAKIKSVLDTLGPNVQRPDITNLQLYKPGSSADNPYGYAGQIALREQFMMTGEMRTLLEHPTAMLSAQEIEAAASRSGMHTMIQDGILKVIAGETTLEEVYRVVG